jgi:ABC-type multidrug transport system fused ATPase/permease subunit
MLPLVLTALANLLAALSTFPVLYSTVGTIAGITHRVAQLLEALEELEVRGTALLCPLNAPRPLCWMAIQSVALHLLMMMFRDTVLPSSAVGLVENLPEPTGVYVVAPLGECHTIVLSGRSCIYAVPTQPVLVGVAAQIASHSIVTCEAATTGASEDSVGLQGVSCCTPDGSTLFKDMTFSVRRGQRLLIMGPSGVGKSSLLRVLAGLWPPDTGTVVMPGEPRFPSWLQ